MTSLAMKPWLLLIMKVSAFMLAVRNKPLLLSYSDPTCGPTFILSIHRSTHLNRQAFVE